MMALARCHGRARASERSLARGGLFALAREVLSRAGVRRQVRGPWREADCLRRRERCRACARERGLCVGARERELDCVGARGLLVAGVRAGERPSRQREREGA